MLPQPEDYLRRPVKIELSKLSCDNQFCRMNQDSACHAYEYVDMMCSPYDYRDQCRLRKVGGDTLNSLKVFFGYGGART